jgi:hypothetical protein
MNSHRTGMELPSTESQITRRGHWIRQPALHEERTLITLHAVAGVPLTVGVL